MSISVVDKISYTLYLNSTDRISGTNNNATFNINWLSLFPNNDHDSYKAIFTFQSVGGYYKDNAGAPMFYNSARILANFHTKSYSLDSASNGPSLNIGVVGRDIQSTTSSSNSFSCYYGYNPSKTISRPIGDQLTIQIYNNYTYTYANNTYVSGTNYLVGAIVFYLTTTYICIQTTTGSQNPTNVSYWTAYTPSTNNSPLQLLTDTTSAGIAVSDMSAWTMIIEFIPCTQSDT